MEYSYSHVPNADEFGALGRREITAFQKWFLSTLDDRMNVLREQVRSFPGYETWEGDFSLDSLEELSGWCCDRAIESFKHSHRVVLDSFGVWMEINVGTYISLVLLHNNDGVKWFFDKTRKRSIDYGQPTVGPFEGAFGEIYRNLMRMTGVAILRMMDGRYGRDGLVSCYNLCVNPIPFEDFILKLNRS